MVADDQGARGVLVGEPAAAERAHRGGHAVGEQEHADQRAGDARDVLQERHDVGQGRVQRREHHEVHDQHGEHPGRERVPGLAGRAAAGARHGRDQRHRGDQRDHAERDDPR